MKPSGTQPRKAAGRRNANSLARSISIRVPIADLEQAQRIAEETGIGYQTVLKQAIRKGLKTAG